MRDFAPPTGTRRCRRHALRYRVLSTIAAAALLAWLFLLLLSFIPAAHAAGCAGLAVEAGIGVHPRNWDAPEYTTVNSLGVLDIRYTCRPWVLSMEHISSLEGFPAVWDSPKEHGYGVNVMSIRVDLLRLLGIR